MFANKKSTIQKEELDMLYNIPEENIEKLRKKVNTIQKKCSRYGNTFIYNEIGEIFEDRQVDGEYIIIRCITVDIAGIAVVNGWRLVASVAAVPGHTSNCIQILDDSLNSVIPTEYWTKPITCDHCSTNRYRKHAYIVYNESSKEFKEVGTSCLKDYTAGLSGEAAAYLCQFVEDMNDDSIGLLTSSNSVRYYPTEECLRIAAECIDKLGWHLIREENNSTYCNALSLYRFHHNCLSEKNLQL